MCNKIYFHNEDEAKKYIRHIRNQKGRKSFGGGSIRGILRPYKCFDCDGYHLTTRPKKADRKYKRQGK